MKGKGFDFKQFAITHGEKIVLGVAGVLALFVLLKTTWGTYQKQPSALKKAAEDASVLIASTKWPATEASKYPPNDTLGIQIGSMLTPIPGDRLTTQEGPGLEFTHSGTFSLYVREKPMTDPNYLPIRNLIATADRMVVAKRSETFPLVDGEGQPGALDPMDPTGAGVKTQPKRGAFRSTKRSGAGIDGTEDNPMGRFGVNPMAAAGRSQIGGTGSATGARPYTGPRPRTTGPATGARVFTGPGSMTRGPMMDDGGSMEMDGEGGGQIVEADGKRVVTVRGIFPIREQMREYERKLHLLEGYSPLEYIRLKDFVLERAVSTDSGKTFAKWTEVDQKANVEYLKTEVADFDTDIVATGVTHYVITSPLPKRLLRYWGDEATHPELDKYNLSEQGRKRQRLINEAIQEQKKLLKKHQEETQPGGFGGIQQNMAGDRSAVMQDTSAMGGFDNYLRQQMSQMYPTGETEDGNSINPTAMLNTIKAEANAVGDLVLFRYFDFNVLPGRTYKYRVKLKLHNPLFGLPVEKLALESQGSNKDEFRETPFSNETTPVTVPTDVDYFVDSIGQSFADYKSSSRMEPPSVSLQVYEWMPDLGTVVKGRITDVGPGQTIAGKDSKTKRLDPAKEELQINVESEFNSNSVLLDLKPGHRKLDGRHLKELGLPHQSRVTAPDQILVVDELGRLKQLDPLSTKYRRSEVERRHNEMLTEFKHWELDPAAVNESALEGDGTDMTDDALDSPIGVGKKQKRKRGVRVRGKSPLRRGGYPGAGGYNPMGYGAGGQAPMPTRFGRGP